MKKSEKKYGARTYGIIFTKWEPKIRNNLTEHTQIEEFLVSFEIKKLVIPSFLIYLLEKWGLKSLKSVLSLTLFYFINILINESLKIKKGFL